MIKHKPICASAAWAFGGEKTLHRSREADFSEVKYQYHVRILLGLANFPINRISELTPIAWAARN
jgi:hypothetical protein